MVDIGFIRFIPVQPDRQDNILIDILHRDEIIILKDESDISPTEYGQFFFLHFQDRMTIYDDLSAVRIIQTADQI